MSDSNTVTTPQRLKKSEAMEHWRQLPDRRRDAEGTTVADVMRTVPAEHTGSTFTQDGIRITGTREFIDFMLGLIKPLLKRENSDERISLNYAESTDRETREPTGFWTCYVQVHSRSGRKRS